MPERTSKMKSKKVAAKKAPAKKKPARRKSSKKAVEKEASDTCFVMMPFGDPFDLYYERVYRPAIEAAGLESVRADDLFRPSAIVADLWKMIQESTVLLAELTTKNATVFYELGLAHAIGKPVVLISETMADVPFDLQQLRVISYNQADPKWGDKLTGKVTAALTETLATPVEAVPMIFRTPVQSQGPEQDALEARVETLESEMRSSRRTDLAIRGLAVTPATTQKTPAPPIGILNSHDALRVSYFLELMKAEAAHFTNSRMDLLHWVRRWVTAGASRDRLQTAGGLDETRRERIDRYFDMITGG